AVPLPASVDPVPASSDPPLIPVADLPTATPTETPTPTSTATTRRRVYRPPPGPAPDCDPPFTIDALGHKHYKLACLK
ncbi:MAG TPA: hypothetical protein VIJ22_17255, partial [Polyangiaceae bacterium]